MSENHGPDQPHQGGLLDDLGGPHPADVEDGGRRTRWPHRSGVGCLVALVMITLLVAGGSLLVVAGVGQVRGLFSGPEDFEGQGTGRVVIEVKDGDSATEIARTLKDAGVVASVDAFVEEARGDDRSSGIQVGFYPLSEEMSAAAAMDVLVDPANLIRARVTIPEGLTTAQVVEILAEQTDFTKKQYLKALDNPTGLGLPKYAKGDVEGFLFPATYDIRPDATARRVLRDMIGAYRQAATELDLPAAARKVGLSPREVVIVASIIEREVSREEDLSGVAAVIENRLGDECPGTNNLLQMDSTVHFAAGDNDSVFTTDAMRQIDSPYNTYRFPGLPPGPISAPGKLALQAALTPEGDNCYFVAVNLETGETRFAETGAEHADNIAVLREYCEDSDLC